MRLTALAAVALTASPALAQLDILIADRGSNKLWRLTDYNNNGLIENPTEVFVYFDGCNTPGTVNLDNINAMAVRPDGLVAGGDQVLRQIYLWRDLNQDGDARDAGESRVAADATNASGLSFSFTTGMQFDSAGRLLIANAGNTFGPDAVYLCRDTTGDGTFQQAGEATMYIADPVFGPGNGPYSPQEIWLDAQGVGYLRNSSANLQAIYRFTDSNTNDHADDAGEWTTFFDVSNASGLPITAGLTLEPDRVRPGALYTQMLASGGVDQVVRVHDTNGINGANDAGEAVLVWSTAETGFTSVDILSLPNGDVLVTDNSGRRIIRLRDNDGDNLFLTSGERTDIFVAAGGPVDEVRAIIALPTLPVPSCGGADFDHDGDAGTDADIEAFFACLGGTCCCNCGSADFDADGDTGTDNDIEAFFRVLGGGAC